MRIKVMIYIPVIVIYTSVCITIFFKSNAIYYNIRTYLLIINRKFDIVIVVPPYTNK